MRPYVAGVLVHEDGEIPLEGDAPTRKRLGRGGELPVERALKPDPKKGVNLERFVVPQRLDMRGVGGTGQLLPMAAALGFLEPAVDRVFLYPGVRVHPESQPAARF